MKKYSFILIITTGLVGKNVLCQSISDDTLVLKNAVWKVKYQNDSSAVFRKTKQDTLSSNKTSALKNYGHFLKTDSTNQQNTFFTGSYGFMYSNLAKVNQGGRGFITSGGFNLARFFSKQIVFGLTFDIKLFKGLWGNNITSNYISDFNKAFQNNLTNQADSARASVLKESLNGNSQYHHPGNYYQTIGIMFSPFPQKYGGCMLMIKRGIYAVPIGGTYGNKYFNNKTSSPDYVSVDVPIKLSIEFAFKPMAFFRNTSKYVNHENKWKDYLRISFFYEQFSWQDADMDGLPFKDFLASDFLNKYSIDQHFGFRICAALY